MALGKKRSQPRHVLCGQLEKIAHRHSHQFGCVNRAVAAASSRSTGPDPNLSTKIGDENLYFSTAHMVGSEAWGAVRVRCADVASVVS